MVIHPKLTFGTSMVRAFLAKWGRAASFRALRGLQPIDVKLSGMESRLPLFLAIVLAANTALFAQQRSFTEYSLPSVPGLPISPLGLATGSDGNVWFTDYGSSRVGKISTKGDATIFAIPSNPAYPTAITSGPDGNLWFVETLSN